jgi:ABC-type oligopeptide transport system ATPase subunit
VIPSVITVGELIVTLDGSLQALVYVCAENLWSILTHLFTSHLLSVSRYFRSSWVVVCLDSAARVFVQMAV